MDTTASTETDSPADSPTPEGTSAFRRKWRVLRPQAAGTASRGGQSHSELVRDHDSGSQTARPPAFGPWAALVVVYVFWGGTYLAIRVGVETVPPLLLDFLPAPLAVAFLAIVTAPAD